MILKGKIVTLRAVEEEDLEFIRTIINDPWYESMIVGWAFPVSKKEEDHWFANFKNSDRCVRYIIETEQDGMVGLTGLKNIDWKNGCAEGGGMRIMNKQFMSKGIATDAYMTLLRYAFNELRLNRVTGSALSHNIASIKATAKVGFKQEGIARQSIFKNGKYHDVVLLAVLKEDYEEIVKNNHYWD